MKGKENVEGKLQWKLIVHRLCGWNHQQVIITLFLKLFVTLFLLYAGPASFYSPNNQSINSPNTPLNVSVGPSGLSGTPVTYEASSPMDSSIVAATPTSSPSAALSPLSRPHTSPVDKFVGGSTGKSPLRSCHTNSDAVTHLRRLATATFVNSSPPNRSPTVVIHLNDCYNWFLIIKLINILVNDVE